MRKRTEPRITGLWFVDRGGRLLDEHRFRSLGNLVVRNLDRIADVDDIGD
jgi:hypothetical protein